MFSKISNTMVIVIYKLTTTEPKSISHSLFSWRLCHPETKMSLWRKFRHWNSQWRKFHQNNISVWVYGKANDISFSHVFPEQTREIHRDNCYQWRILHICYVYLEMLITTAMSLSTIRGIHIVDSPNAIIAMHTVIISLHCNHVNIP